MSFVWVFRHGADDDVVAVPHPPESVGALDDNFCDVHVSAARRRVFCGLRSAVIVLRVSTEPVFTAVSAGPSSTELDQWMGLALGEARRAVEHGDVPVGAVVVINGDVVAARHNERELTGDPTAHAEVLALRDAAAKLGRWRLDGATLIVTLEPCPMCAGAAVNARLAHLVYGAGDPKAGATGSLYNLCADARLNHEIAVTPFVRADESSALLRSFFADRR